MGLLPLRILVDKGEWQTHELVEADSAKQPSEDDVEDEEEPGDAGGEDGEETGEDESEEECDCGGCGDEGKDLLDVGDGRGEVVDHEGGMYVLEQLGVSWLADCVGD